MNLKKLFAPTCLGLAVIAGSIAIAQPTKEKPPATPAKAPPTGQPEMKLPPGWTTEDMQACMMAGMPGKMHEFLAKSIGTWQGKCTQWMGPDTEPMKSECTDTITKVFDGQYTKSEITGEIPGMGMFTGIGYNGFDNVSQKFVSTWIDNHSTGIMNGTGELSGDSKTLTWNYTMNCPLTKKPQAIRQVEKYTSDKAFTMEMFTTDPKSGKEYKMMSIEFTRK